MDIQTLLDVNLYHIKEQELDHVKKQLEKLELLATDPDYFLNEYCFDQQQKCDLYYQKRFDELSLQDVEILSKIYHAQIDKINKFKTNCIENRPKDLYEYFISNLNSHKWVTKSSIDHSVAQAQSLILNRKNCLFAQELGLIII